MRMDGCGRREQGSRDWRMLPVALTVWAAALGTRWLFAAVMEPTADGWWMDVGIGWVLAAGAFGAAAGVGVGRGWWRPTRATVWMTTMVCCAALTACVSTWCVNAVVWHDPVSVRVRDGPVHAVMQGTVRAPVTVAGTFGADCRSETRLTRVTIDGVDMATSVDVRLYASGEQCAALARDARYRFSGHLAENEFGGQRVRLTLDDAQGARLASAPPLASRIVAHMQEAFFAATDDLSDQARVLVPGLTIGVLGSERYAARSGGASEIDTTYAGQLEERFRRSGIMHLMAVSGGHFVLVAALVRRLCAWLLAHRYVVATATAGAYLGLSALMFPSDSVTRALTMGCLTAAATAAGRRPQAMSALCWTVVIVIVARPDMAASYGFALSCAAVFGIITCTGAIAARLERFLPAIVAEAVALTVAAQCCTLPVQILMEPAVPLMSVPANLIVTPVVGTATMTGLACLLTAWCCPPVGGALAWVTGWGTKVMECCAMWLGGDDRMTLPWADGVTGAVSVLGAEAAIAALVTAVDRLRTDGRRLQARTDEPGEPWQAMRNRYERIGLWINQTPKVFGTWEDQADHSPDNRGKCPAMRRD